MNQAMTYIEVIKAGIADGYAVAQYTWRHDTNYEEHSLTEILHRITNEKCSIELAGHPTAWYEIGAGEYELRDENDHIVIGKIQMVRYDHRPWQAYCDYLVQWASSHRDPGFCGNTPACYDEWFDGEWADQNDTEQKTPDASFDQH